jgi:mannitol-specific phosphotransferase system IIBC component
MWFYILSAFVVAIFDSFLIKVLLLKSKRIETNNTISQETTYNAKYDTSNAENFVANNDSLPLINKG